MFNQSQFGDKIAYQDSRVGGKNQNFPPPPCKGSIAPIYTKNLYDLTIAIINKCFEFQNDWLKIIPVRYNCTQFCSIPLC